MSLFLAYVTAVAILSLTIGTPAWATCGLARLVASPASWVPPAPHIASHHLPTTLGRIRQSMTPRQWYRGAVARTMSPSRCAGAITHDEATFRWCYRVWIYHVSVRAELPSTSPIPNVQPSPNPNSQPSTGSNHRWPSRGWLASGCTSPEPGGSRGSITCLRLR